MTKKKQILELHNAGKNTTEIISETGFRPIYVKYILKQLEKKTV